MATMAQASLDGIALGLPSLPRPAIARPALRTSCMALETIAPLRDDLTIMLPTLAA
jgi:hypothetical protein